jgi:hypothetical protein
MTIKIQPSTPHVYGVKNFSLMFVSLLEEL